MSNISGPTGTTVKSLDYLPTPIETGSPVLVPASFLASHQYSPASASETFRNLTTFWSTVNCESGKDLVFVLASAGNCSVMPVA